MKKSSIIALFILSLFAASMLHFSSAQTPTAGVSEGDVFVYDISVTWNSTDPTAPVPEEYVGLQDQQWLSIKVTEVNGSTFYLESTLHFKNGTEETQEGGRWVGYITEPNLSANETAVWFSIYQGTNETFLRTYSGVERETNHVVEHIPVADRRVFPALLEVYVDKKTGVLVEYRHEVPVSVNEYENGKYDVSWLNILIKLRDPKAWSTPQFPLLLVAPFVIIPAIAGVTIAVRKAPRKATPQNGI